MKTKKIHWVVANVCVLLTAFLFCCKKNTGMQPDQNASTGEVFKINFTPAKTNGELIEIRSNPKNNIIRTLADFDKAASSLNSPLLKLSATDLALFKSDIVTRDGVGVVGLKYGDIKRLLSYDDFATVLSYFGLDAKGGYWGFSNDPLVIQKMKIPALKTNSEPPGDGGDFEPDPNTDYQDYWCSKKHNCTKEKDYICMSGCDKDPE